MGIRKEQGLLIGAVALIALLVVTGRKDELRWRRVRPKARPYERVALPSSTVVSSGPLALAKLHDLFEKPSKTTQLPPPDWPVLELPPFPVLPVVEPPMDAGPSLRFWHLRRIDTQTLTVNLKPRPVAGEGQAGPVPDGGRQGPTGEGQEAAPDHSATYDRLEEINGKLHWGRVLGAADRYAHGLLSQDTRLRLQAPFQGEIPFQVIDPEKGTVKFEFRFPADQVASLIFANNIQNRIAMMRRHIPPGDTGLRDRTKFVYELLADEREHPEALEQAEVQAKEFIAVAPGDPRGHELLGWVYATTGQLEKELALYDDLSQGTFKSHAFVARGRGVLEGRFGLWEDAERHLRDAVRLDAGDPRNQLELSLFLLARGRAKEALPVARKARQQIVPGMSPQETHDIHVNLVRALLAVGENDEALTAQAAAEGESAHPQVGYLRGCVQYAKGQYEESMAAFQEAAGAMPLSAMPLIGAGLCAFRQKDYDQALTLFRTAAERDPLERHLALAAQGFLLLLSPSRVGEAVARCEEAQRIAPRDPYVLYLLGRAYREAGRLQEARATLDACLGDHHDFVEAMAELAWTQLTEARQGAAGLADLLTGAERLAARAVIEEADRAKLWIYQDLLGVVRYHLGKNEPSRQAFLASEKWGGDLHPKLWLALLRNRLGHIDDAISQLRQVWEFLRDEKDPVKVFANRTIGLLSFHRGKRLFRDGFTTLGKHWVVAKMGQRNISWRAADGLLRARGAANKEGPAYARFVVPNAKDFVEAEIELTVGAENGVTVLLRISDETVRARRAESRFECRAGFNFGSGYVYLRSGTAENDKSTTQLRADERPELALTRGTPVKINVRNFTGIDGMARKGEIIVTWNGVEVARRAHSFQSTRRALNIDLRVGCKAGQKVDAAFGNFRLITTGD